MSTASAAPALDQAGAVREENAVDVARILPFLHARIPDLPAGSTELRQFQGGASNLTYLLKIGEREMILRCPPAGTKAKSAHDMGREFRVMQRLSPHFPCPRPLAYCEDESLIGSPFFVMEKLAGVILRRDLPKTLNYSPEQARQLCTNLIDTQIQLHTLDYTAAGLSDLGKPSGYVARQVSGWCERFEQSRTDDAPDYQPLMTWLKRQQPADSPKSALIHNDYRFDNVVLSPADTLGIIGVLDWEMATLGDPLMDLGASLAYWVQADDPATMQAIRMQPSHLPGMMTREEVVRHYAERTGREIVNWDFYYVFGLFRLGVIAQQIYQRYKLGQSRNPRFQTFNSFVAVLAEAAGAVIARSKN